MLLIILKMRDRNAELREWFGMTLADLCVYISCAAMAVMFLMADLKQVLAIAALVFAVAAMPLGMRRNPKLSSFTNAVKLWSYPIWLLIVILAIAYRYGVFRITS